MSPPKDPPSGKFRRDVPHVDHAHREVTRPGPHVDLDATDDDFPPQATPVEALIPVVIVDLIQSPTLFIRPVLPVGN
jgi:hypothetical protein